MIDLVRAGRCCPVPDDTGHCCPGKPLMPGVVDDRGNILQELLKAGGDFRRQSRRQAGFQVPQFTKPDNQQERGDHAQAKADGSGGCIHPCYDIQKHQ